MTARTRACASACATWPTADAWQIAERRYDARARSAMRVRLRGRQRLPRPARPPEEGAPAHDAGAILNGFHETWPIVYPEDAYGLARTGQTIVNATDGTIIRLFVDDEPFDLATARVAALRARARHARRRAQPRGRVRDRRAAGASLVRSRRLASLEDRHLAAIDYEVVALDARVRIAVSSELVTHGGREAGDDPRRGKGFAEKVLDADRGPRRRQPRACCTSPRATAGSSWRAGWTTRSRRARRSRSRRAREGDGAQVVVLAELAAGESLRLRKFVAYHWAARRRRGDLLRARRAHAGPRAARRL